MVRHRVGWKQRSLGAGLAGFILSLTQIFNSPQNSTLDRVGRGRVLAATP